MPDPLTQAQQAIWAALLADDEFTDGETGIRPGNRIATVTVEDTITGVKRVNRAPADYPELLVTPRSLTPISGRNSKTFGAAQTFTIQIVDNKRTVERMNALLWLLVKIFAREQRKAHPFGLTFLRDWGWAAGTQGREVNQDNQQVGNWVSLCDIVMQFDFAVSDLAN